MSGVTFNWRNNKSLIVSPLLEITTAILPPPHTNQCPLPPVQLCMQSHSYDGVAFSVFYKVVKPPVVISVFGVAAH